MARQTRHRLHCKFGGRQIGQRTSRAPSADLASDKLRIVPHEFAVGEAESLELARTVTSDHHVGGMR